MKIRITRAGFRELPTSKAMLVIGINEVSAFLDVFFDGSHEGLYTTTNAVASLGREVGIFHEMELQERSHHVSHLKNKRTAFSAVAPTLGLERYDSPH